MLHLLRLLPIFSVLLGACASHQTPPPPTNVFLISTADQPSPTPRIFLAQSRRIPADQICGFYFVDSQLHVILSFEGSLYTVAVINATIAHDQRAKALETVASAAIYDWTIEAAYPLVAATGFLNVTVRYDTGLAIRDLANEVVLSR